MSEVIEIEDSDVEQEPEVIEIPDDAPQLHWNGINWHTIHVPSPFDNHRWPPFVELMKQSLPWQAYQLPNPHERPTTCTYELQRFQRRGGFNPVELQGMGTSRDPVILNDDGTTQRRLPILLQAKIPPVAWQRPKPFMRQAQGRGGRWYAKNTASPQNKKNKKEFHVAIWDYVDRYCPRLREETAPLTNRFGDMPVHLELTFHMALPNKAFINEDRNRELKESWLCRFQTKTHACTKRPDLDNMVKFVKDALEGMLYHDDKQVVSCHAVKVWDLEHPHTGRTEIQAKLATSADMPDNLYNSDPEV